MQKLTSIIVLGISMALTGLQLQAEDMDYYGADKPKPVSKEKGMNLEQAKVVISTPIEGAVLAANQPIKVSYMAKPGPKGNHVHLYVDGERIAVLQQLNGDYELKKLSPGKHKISIEVVTKDHQPVGAGKEVNIEIR